MIKKRKVIRAASFLLALCLIVFVSDCFSLRAKNSYEQTLERVRLTNLNALCGYVGALSSSLSLLSVSADVDALLTVSSCASSAIAVSGCFDSEKISNISRFLAVAYSFSESYRENEKNKNAASELSDYAEEMYFHLSDMAVDVMNGAYSLSEYGSVYQKNEKPYFEDYLDFENGNENGIYSLAASGESLRAEPHILKNAEPVTLEKAKKKASEIDGTSEILWRNAGKKNNYGFGVYSLFHGDTAVEITEKGAFLCRFVRPTACGTAVFSLSQAEEGARLFAKEQGYGNTAVFSRSSDGISAYFTLVPEVEGIYLLTAQIKASVCLSDAEITFFDASEYIKNFRESIGFIAKEADVSPFLPDGLNAVKSGVCLAEIDGEEKLCRFAVCPFEGNAVIVFLDYDGLFVLKTKKIFFTDLK